MPDILQQIMQMVQQQQQQPQSYGGLFQNLARQGQPQQMGSAQGGMASIAPFLQMLMGGGQQGGGQGWGNGRMYAGGNPNFNEMGGSGASLPSGSNPTFNPTPLGQQAPQPSGQPSPQFGGGRMYAGGNPNFNEMNPGSWMNSLYGGSSGQTSSPSMAF